MDDVTSKGFLVTGTDTGVGKTVVTAGLAGVFCRHGLDAVAIKPVHSGARLEDGELVPEDALFYRLATGLTYPLEQLNLYRFAPAVSPHLAAELSGQKVDPRRVVDFCQQALLRHQVTLIEGAGGLCVPLSGPHFTVADLARDLSLPLIVVARIGLGTINHTVLTVAYARNIGLRVAGIIFNSLRPGEAGPVERDNPGVIAEMTGVPVLGILPYLPGVSVEQGTCEGLVEAVEKHVLWGELLTYLKS